MIIVLPVCNKDAHLLKAGLDWMLELDGQQDLTAVLISEKGTRGSANLLALAREAFRRVGEYVHPPPPPGYWPPSWVWQQAARYVAPMNEAWYWHEADAWALCSGWFGRLESGYKACGKMVMGPVVPVMGHMNGTAVYPAGTAKMFPLAMNVAKGAWDMQMKHYIGQVANTRLIQHAWMCGKGRFMPYGNGLCPSFPDEERMSWIWPEAVIFHRCKDLSLVRRLRGRKLVEAGGDYMI